MKQLLDRLMARQQRLMGRLDPPVAELPRQPAPSAEARAERSRLEAEALDAALEKLAQGDIAAAKALLDPFEHDASLVRTLTTLSRLANAQGDFEAAVALLVRAEKLDPTERKVWRLLAQAYAVRGMHTDEVRQYRRLAFVDPDAPAEAYVDLVRAIFRALPAGKKVGYPEVRLAAQRLLAAPDLTPEARVRFAEAQYLFEGMAKEARELYVAASAPQAGERDVTAQWLRLTDWCKHIGTPAARMVEGGVPSHRPAIAELEGVYVFPRLQWAPVVNEGRVALAGFMMQRAQLRSEDPASPLLMNRKTHAELRIPADPLTIDTPALLIGGMNQYYHNTVEMLSSLAVAETLEVGTTLPLVVNEDLGEFQKEQLAMLGYGTDRLILVRADRPVRFSRLCVPTRLVRGGRWVDPLVPQWYRRRLVTPGAASTRRLYLSRAGTSRRRVSNEADLVAMLSSRGYEVVHPETLSVRAQIDLFSRASHIVGASGAALSNMVFAAPGAQVVALYNKHFVSGGADMYFDALAQACGHRFSPVMGTPAQARDGDRLIDADIMIDVEAVRDAID
jgi:capsular polysaccharide biosynthesis protein